MKENNLDRGVGGGGGRGEVGGGVKIRYIWGLKGLVFFLFF